MKRWSEMSPKERDALVSEKVMGWNKEESGGLTWWEKDGKRAHKDSIYKFSPPYSTDIAAAWEIMDKGLVESVIKLKDGRWYAHCPYKEYDLDLEKDVIKCGANSNSYYEIPIYEDNKENGAFAKSAPEAICLAALKALGIQV